MVQEDEAGAALWKESGEGCLSQAGMAAAAVKSTPGLKCSQPGMCCHSASVKKEPTLQPRRLAWPARLGAVPVRAEATDS